MSADMDDMRNKTDDELYEIVAKEQEKKEQREHEFQIMVVKSLIRIEKALDGIREQMGLERIQ